MIAELLRAPVQRAILSHEEWRRALEERCDVGRGRRTLLIRGRPEALQCERDNQAYEENRHQVESDSGSAGLCTRGRPMGARRELRVRLVSCGEELHNGIGIIACVFNAGLDAGQRGEADGSHRNPDPRAF